MAKVSTLAHFLLELGCQDYSFLNHTPADFEHGFDSILTDSYQKLKTGCTIYEPEAMTYAVSSGFLCLVTTIF